MGALNRGQKIFSGLREDLNGPGVPAGPTLPPTHPRLGNHRPKEEAWWGGGGVGRGCGEEWTCQGVGGRTAVGSVRGLGWG